MRSLLAPLALLLLAACGRNELLAPGDSQHGCGPTALRSLAPYPKASLAAVGHVDRTAVVIDVLHPASIDEDGSIAANDTAKGGAVVWRKGAIRHLDGLEVVSQYNGGYAIGRAGTPSRALLLDPSGAATDLGELSLVPGATPASVASAMNANALVTGRSNGKPFFWTSCAGMVELPTDSGSAGAGTSAINALAEVVGTESGLPLTIMNRRRARPTLWRTRTGERIDLFDIVTVGTVGNSVEAWANGINDAGTVVGFTGHRVRTAQDHEAGFAWTWNPVDGMQQLGTLGGDYAEAKKVNNRGEAIGVSTYGDCGRPQCPAHAFVWTREGGMERLNPSDTASTAIAINDQGEIVGIVGNQTVVWVPTANLSRFKP